MNRTIGGSIAVVLLTWALRQSTPCATAAPPPTTTTPAAPAAPDLPPERAVVIDTKRHWRQSFGPAAYHGHAPAGNVARDLEAEHAIFYVGEPGGRNVWYYQLDAPPDRDRYPILAVSYRAVNVDTTSPHVLVWAGEGADAGGAGGSGASILCNEIVANGEPHELRKHTRPEPGGTERRTILLGLTADKAAGAAMFEILSLRFETDPTAPPAPPVAEDAPITVKVLGPNGSPLAGATVTSDPERKNWARAATTGADGVATVRPLKHGEDAHTLRVEKDGFVPFEHTRAAGTPDAPLELRPPIAVRYGGVVKDADGTPLAAASVHHSVVWQPDAPDTRIVPASACITDESGHWLSAPLPDAPFRIGVDHRDYPRSTRTVIEQTDELKAGTHETVLTK